MQLLGRKKQTVPTEDFARLYRLTAFITIFNSMKQFEFERLSLDKKCRYVLSRCVFVASRRMYMPDERPCRINLYHNGRTFFEIWYNSKHNYIGDVKLCSDNQVLDPYLDQIDLEKIVLS